MNELTPRLKFLKDCLDDSEYWYLTGPYSGNEDYNHAEHERAAAHLLNNGIWIYSPIMHCHAMATKYAMPRDALFWQKYNEIMINSSFGVLVYTLPKWQDSKGTRAEMLYAESLCRPVELIGLSDIP